MKGNQIMIEEDYVSFEIAKLLKEKGFEQNTNLLPYYTDNGNLFTGDINTPHIRYYNAASAPTLQMAMKWFREKHCIFIATEFGWFHGDYEYQASVVKMNPTMPPTLDSIDHIKGFRNKSYEIACEAAIKYCLDNIIAL